MTSFIENMIQLAEDEDKLFESMLKIEFRKAEVIKEAEAGTALATTNNNDAIDAEYKEAPAEDNNSTNDADNAASKNIGQAILNAIKKFIGAITSTVGNIIEKIKKMLYSDSGLVKKFSDALSVNGALKGFEGIKNFKVPNLDWNFPEASAGDFLKPFENFANGNMLVTFDVNKVKSEYADEIIMSCNSAFTNGGNPVELWCKDGQAPGWDWKKACETLNSGKISKGLFILLKRATGLLGLLNRAKIKDSYRNTNELSTYLKDSKDVAKKIISTHTEYFKSLRTSIFTCGTYVLKSQKAQTAEANPAVESANLAAYLVGSKCEDYLNEQFSFV